jgi:hypothetical protein
VEGIGYSCEVIVKDLGVPEEGMVAAKSNLQRQSKRNTAKCDK